MGRGTSQEGLANSQKANSLSDSYNTNAKSAYDVLAPTLTHQVTNPQGFAPEDLSDMNTASQQSLGGSNAGIEGEGMLRAARSRNAGAGDAATAEGAREAMRRSSQNAVTIKANNALEREKNRNAGVAGMGELYGENQDATLKALGISNQALDVKDRPGFWETFGNSFAGTLGKTLGGGNASQNGGWLGMGG
jgi:hypothetical protein